MYGVRSFFERELFDNALMAGMTPDEFWFGDPEMYFNYIRVYERKQKMESQQIWSMGARMCQALSSTPVFPVGLIDRKVVSAMPKYPDCPFTEEEKKKGYSEKEKEYLRTRFQVQLENWVKSFKR